LIKEDFTFDFRYYKSSNEGHSGGHYIFHTDDRDSTPFHHEITEILSFKGETVEQYLVYYKYPKELWVDSVLDYYVKIKIYKCVQMDNKIEFDVFFGRIHNHD
jgi:hypothetical protein